MISVHDWVHSKCVSEHIASSVERQGALNIKGGFYRTMRGDSADTECSRNTLIQQLVVHTYLGP